MRTKLKYLFILITSVILYSCGNPEPMRTDFIGTWKSSDGAIIKLYKNDECEISNLNYKNIYSFDNTPSILNCKGIWKFINVNDEPVVDITYEKGGNYKYKGQIRPNISGFHLSISGQGLLENQPPWKLFVFIGDPDNMNKYEFIKNH